ncbi:S1C family serine protease [Oleispirillum naphthae]|uniref:S1C family serine protease n=1 Tax=Oleispirillum naphthae TaxID=2838853 RepID=UPI003082684C
MLAVAAAGLGLAACQMPMEIPEVKQRQQIEIPMGEETAPFSYAGAISKIPRGTTIAAFPDIGGVKSLTCVAGRHISLEWGGRIAGAWSSEMNEVFFSTMKESGYNVLGDPSSLFNRGADRARAHYRVGARLVDIRGNFCDEITFWWGVPTNRIMGEMYVKVEWEVYSEPERRVVGKFVTEGRGEQKTPAVEATVQAMGLAFSMAVANLAADPAYHDLMREDSRRTPPKGDGDARLELVGAPLSRDAIADRIDRILGGAVSIITPEALGSGFFISRDGYGLTNAHVVGEADHVTLRLNSGVEVRAEVLRVKKARDVALFKAPVQVLHPLPLAPQAKLVRLDEVYAVGTPNQLSLQSTVTKGVVSAFRNFDERGGKPVSYIQADAAITHGNSGGPLLNRSGNVVGISVAMIAPKDVQIGLNLFIPIQSALTSLNLDVRPPAR